MDIAITTQKEMPMLGRSRVVATVTYTGTTPSKAKIRDRLAEATKKAVEAVEIRHIYTHYGKESAKIIAHVYEDPQILSAVVKYGKKRLAKIKAAVVSTETPSSESTPVESA